MKIYTLKEVETGLIFRSKRSNHHINFKIILNENKPQITGSWNGFGGFGGVMKLSNVKLWSFFLKELKDAAIKDNLKFII